MRYTNPALVLGWCNSFRSQHKEPQVVYCAITSFARQARTVVWSRSFCSWYTCSFILLILYHLVSKHCHVQRTKAGTQ